jgi:hypothetical protein
MMRKVATLASRIASGEEEALTQSPLKIRIEK